MVVLALVVAEVKVGQHLDALRRAVGDLVEGLLHLRGELVVHQPREVLHQQPGNGEREPGRYQRRALLEHVVAARDGPDDRGVGGRPTDLQFLQLGYQRGFGVARRRLCLVSGGGHVVGAQALPLGQLRQPALRVVALLARALTVWSFLHRLHVGLQEAVEGDRAAAGGEGALLTRRGLSGDPHADRFPLSVGHLGGYGPHPDQLVEPERVTAQTALGRGPEGVTRGPDGLVRLLSVLHLGGVDPGASGQVALAEQLGDLGAGGGDGAGGQCHRVGTHVGDIAALVQLLRHRHRPLGGETELAARLLLQGGGPKGCVGATGIGLGLDRGDGVARGLQPGGQLLGRRLVKV